MPTGNDSKAAARKSAPNRATGLRFERDAMVVQLGDGRELSVPLKHYPTLRAATTEQRDGWELLGRGRAIHWEPLDLDLSVDGLLNGRSERIPMPPTVRASKLAVPSRDSGHVKPRRVG